MFEFELINNICAVSRIKPQKESAYMCTLHCHRSGKKPVNFFRKGDAFESPPLHCMSSPCYYDHFCPCSLIIKSSNIWNDQSENTKHYQHTLSWHVLENRVLRICCPIARGYWNDLSGYCFLFVVGKAPLVPLFWW